MEFEEKSPDYKLIDYEPELLKHQIPKNNEEISSQLYGKKKDLFRTMIDLGKELYEKVFGEEPGLIELRQKKLSQLSLKQAECNKIYEDILVGNQKLRKLKEIKEAEYRTLNTNYFIKLEIKEKLKQNLLLITERLQEQLGVEEEFKLKTDFVTESKKYDNLLLEIDVYDNNINQYKAIISKINSDLVNSTQALNKIKITSDNAKYAKELIEAIEPIASVVKASKNMQGISENLESIIGITDRTDELIGDAMLELNQIPVNTFKSKNSEDSSRKFIEIFHEDLEERIKKTRKLLEND